MQYRNLVRKVVWMFAFFVSAFVATAQIGPVGGGQGGPPEMAITTYQQTTGATPGEAARLAVVIEIPEGWHINAHQPLDEYLIPTEVEFEPPQGFVFKGVVYPEPILASFSFSEEKLAVYEHRATIGIVIGVGENVAPGEYELTGTLRYQACNDTVCAPPKTVPFTATLAVVAP
ncbi:MAG: protein-disulfide reductase DsbD family protein, partial [Candidatus Hydrogenedentota bacterium]